MYLFFVFTLTSTVKNNYKLLLLRTDIMAFLANPRIICLPQQMYQDVDADCSLPAGYKHGFVFSDAIPAETYLIPCVCLCKVDRA